MAIKTSMQIGDIIQFPSHSLKKILQIKAEWIIFGAMSKPKKGTAYSCNAQKRSTYSKDFVLAHCDLVPNGADLQHYLNGTYKRRSAATVATIDAYSDTNVLQGFVIDDEEVLDMPPIEEYD
jgi:hypothetical protein